MCDIRINCNTWCSSQIRPKYVCIRWCYVHAFHGTNLKLDQNIIYVLQQDEARARAASQHEATRKAQQLLKVEKERRESLVRGHSRRNSASSASGETGRDEHAPASAHKLRSTAAVKGQRQRQWRPAGVGHTVDQSKGRALGLPPATLH
jgi:hypothetical protein